jgi:hypothetical protein
MDGYLSNYSNKLTLKGDKTTWYPTPINTLVDHLAVVIISCPDFPVNSSLALKKNIAYNLQYVEFLDRLIKDVNLSAVLWTQNVKSFAIHAAAVIEAFFYYVIVSTGHASVAKWESCQKFKSNQYQINNTWYINETEMFIKADVPGLVDMTFDQMSKKVETKKLLGDVGDLYKEISRIRKLRNKIHLHIIQSSEDTDYNTFKQSEYELTRRVLHGVLISPLFKKSSHHNYFDYLINS